MTKPETKVVLKRTFTWSNTFEFWVAHLKHPTVLYPSQLRLLPPNWGDIPHIRTEDWMAQAHGQTGRGPTEADAILALQSQLRKMAELEVAE